MLSVSKLDKQLKKLIKKTNKDCKDWPKEGFLVKPMIINEDLKTGEITEHEISFKQSLK